MSTRSISQLTTRRKVAVAVVVAVVLVGVLIAGWQLREQGPGDMGDGFLLGAALGVLLALGMLWRASRRPDRATTFERAWTQTGDERDDLVLTRALAVLGVSALPLTGVAAIAIALGAAIDMSLALLLLAELAIAVGAFAVVSRRT